MLLVDFAWRYRTWSIASNECDKSVLNSCVLFVKTLLVTVNPSEKQMLYNLQFTGSRSLLHKYSMWRENCAKHAMTCACRCNNYARNPWKNCSKELYWAVIRSKDKDHGTVVLPYPMESAKSYDFRPDAPVFEFMDRPTPLHFRDLRDLLQYCQLRERQLTRVKAQWQRALSSPFRLFKSRAHFA